MLALVWTAFIVLAVWFLLLRPQRKRMQEHQELMQSLRVGHQVITAGGIHGRIDDLSDDVAWLEIAPGTRIELDRRAIARNLDAASETDDEPAEEAEEHDVGIDERDE